MPSERDDRELKVLVDRAERERDKRGATRREALTRLIDAAHASNPSLKKLAANRIHTLIPDFPDLEDGAINAVYDLCEDPSMDIRIAGYNAITTVSQVQKKWIKRNTDVLVQLLQSDEVDEVHVVKKGLRAHLDMDPVVTLNVLRDQIIPPDEAIEEDELSTRDRLRNLVLSFLCEDALSSVKRLVQPQTPQEEVLVLGMVKAIPRLRYDEIETIVERLLLSLDSFTPECKNSTYGNKLVHVLLLSTKAALTPVVAVSALSQSVKQFVRLLHEVVLARKAADAGILFRFLDENMLSNTILERFDPETIKQVAITVAGTLDGMSKGKEPVHDNRLKISSISPVLLKVLSSAEDTQSRRAILTLLENCKWRRDKMGWTIPGDVADALHTVQSSIDKRNDSMDTEEDDDVPQIIILLKSLLRQPVSKPVSIKRKASEMDSTTAPSATPSEAWTLSARILKSNRILSIKRQRTEDSATGPALAMPISPTQSSAPSLLSRLGAAGMTIRSNQASAKAQNADLQKQGFSPQGATRPTSKSALAASTIDQLRKDLEGGFKIKGAASSASVSPTLSRLPTESKSHPGSLLDRLGPGIGATVDSASPKRIWKKKK